MLRCSPSRLVGGGRVDTIFQTEGTVRAKIRRYETAWHACHLSIKEVGKQRRKFGRGRTLKALLC